MSALSFAEQADTAVMAASSTILRATSNAIGGGMKLVGQTVSRLSSSFSQDKDDGTADAANDSDLPWSPPAANAEFPLLERSTAPPEFGAVVSRWNFFLSFSVQKYAKRCGPEWGRVGWRSGKPRTSRDRDARLALIGIDLIQFESV